MSAVLSALRRERWAYLWLNLAYYGLVGAGMAWAAFNRPLQEQLLTMVEGELSAGSLAPVSAIYDRGGVLLAAAVTFGVNLVIGSLASITLPSLVVPFSGLGLAAVRAVLWGLLFAPGTLDMGGGEAVAGLSVALVVLLEGQGYVLGACSSLRGRSIWAEGKRWRASRSRWSCCWKGKGMCWRGWRRWFKGGRSSGRRAWGRETGGKVTLSGCNWR